MEAMLLKAAMKIVTTVNREKDHIPPITTSESNPFPYQIVINPKADGWGTRIGLFWGREGFMFKEFKVGK
jgi:autophagy-related protein 101